MSPRRRGLSTLTLALLAAACEQKPPAGGETSWAPPDVCADRPAAGRFTCAQEARWGKCGEAWLRNCDETCGRCYQGAQSCPAAVEGERIGARLRFDAPLTSFARTFELRYNNPNHPDYDQVRISRDASSLGHTTLRGASWTVYGTDRVTVVLDLETGQIVRQAETSGRDLGTARLPFPSPAGDAGAYRKALATLREIVSRVQAGYWLPDAGFEQSAVPELIGALCYLDALDAALQAGAASGAGAPAAPP